MAGKTDLFRVPIMVSMYNFLKRSVLGAKGRV